MRQRGTPEAILLGWESLVWALPERARRALNYPWFLYKTRAGSALEHGRHAGDGRAMIQHFDYSPSILRFAEAFLAGGDLTTEAPLDASSVVFDVGASNGDWAHRVRERYGCRVECFEPNPEDFVFLDARFAVDPRVRRHPFGLAAASGRARLSVDGMSSSVFEDAPNYGESKKADVELRDVAEPFAELEPGGVDLVKINIEGGEYDLLDRMLAKRLHTRCGRLRVQFHRWFRGAVRRRARIRRELAKTHRLEWDYPFVWESWVRRG